MEPSVLTTENITSARASLSRTARLRFVRLAAIHAIFGFVTGLLVYLATPYDLQLATLIGLACAAFSSIPVALHWRRHYARLSVELDAIEQDVSTGKLVYNTTFEILARNARDLADGT